MLESAIERPPTESVQPAASQLDRVHVSHVPKNRRLRVVLQRGRLPYSLIGAAAAGSEPRRGVAATKPVRVTANTFGNRKLV